MNREQLTKHLKKYQTSYDAEKAFIPRILELLKEENCYSRELLTGHLTGSAWILNVPRNSALLTHHRKLNRWLQLGGHADGNENILDVALTEAKEESGLSKIIVPDKSIFDIDIHLIPARKNIPAHYHYDIRFLFIANHLEKLNISHESKDLKWVAIDKIAELTDNNTSILRMAAKSIATVVR